MNNLSYKIKRNNKIISKQKVLPENATAQIKIVLLKTAKFKRKDLKNVNKESPQKE